jgi:tetratricopeptide (TPR) repeat protein
LLLPGACGPSREVRQFNQMGLEHYHAGRYYEAINMFEKAREEDRERPEASYYIGRCYLAMAEQRYREDNLVAGMRLCDRAAMEFERAYAAFPGYTLAIQGKTESLKLRGQYARAVELAGWAAAHAGPKAKMLILEAREWSQAGDLEQSLKRLKQAVAVEPDNAATHAELGRFYLRCDNKPEALRALRRAYDLDPGAPGVVSALSELGELTDTAEPR